MAPGGAATATGRARERFVVCHNPERRRPRRRGPRQRLIEHLQRLIDGSDAWTDRRRDELVGSPQDQARAAPLAAPHQDRAAAHRPRRRATRNPLRRQVAAAHLRPHADPRGPGRRLQAAHRGGTRLARLQRQPRAAPGLPPPRGPHPRPRPIMLAGTASHPGGRNPHRRHLAQPAPRTRPHAPGHPRHRRRPRRSTLGPHHAARRPSSPRSTCPNPPPTSASSQQPAAEPPAWPRRARSNTTSTRPALISAAQTHDHQRCVPIICGSPDRHLRRM